MQVLREPGRAFTFYGRLSICEVSKSNFNLLTPDQLLRAMVGGGGSGEIQTIELALLIPSAV